MSSNFVPKIHSFICCSITLISENSEMWGIFFYSTAFNFSGKNFDAPFASSGFNLGVDCALFFRLSF